MNRVFKVQQKNSDLSLIFDDGKVAYAYFLKGSNLIADVWLYNHGHSPANPEWDEGPHKMPFRNSLEFTAAQLFAPVSDASEIEVKWLSDPHQHESIYADLFIRGNLHARLRPNDKPEKCVLATKDGPIAKIF